MQRGITGIYKITSPSGKVYIGQAVDIRKRFKEYDKLHCKQQPKLYNSFCKYGVNKHAFDVQEICDVCDLNDREIYWSAHYNSVKSGLNTIQPGGWPDREATRIKMVANGKNQKVNVEQLKSVWERNRGRTGSLCHNAKVVFQYNMRGEFIREWGAIKEAANELGIGYQHISSVCNGNRYSAGLSLWRYESTHYYGQMIEVPRYLKQKNKRVAQIDTNGNIIVVWINVREAAKSTTLREFQIRERCRANFGFIYLKH